MPLDTSGASANEKDAPPPRIAHNNQNLCCCARTVIDQSKTSYSKTKPNETIYIMLAFAKRQRAMKEIDRRRRDLKTYTDPLDQSQEDLEDFLIDFNSNILFKKQVEMQQIFLEHPVVQGFYRELVPNVIEHEDFWQRYYYRTSSTDRVLQDLDIQDVAKLKSRSESVKKSWSEVTTPSVDGVLTQYSVDLDALRKLSPKRESSARTVGISTAGAENVENAPSQPSPSRAHKNQRKGGLFDRSGASMKTAEPREETNLLLKWSRSLANINLNMDQNESKEMETADEILTEQPETKEEASVKEVVPIHPVVSLEKLSTNRTEDDTPILAEEFFAEDDVVGTESFDAETSMDTEGEAKQPKRSSSSLPSWLLLFALLGIGCAAAIFEIQANHPNVLVTVQNCVCGPVVPWLTLLSTKPTEAEAPWFAPGSSEAFRAVCGTSRPRTSIKWQKSRKGLFSLTVSNVSNKKRLVNKNSLRSVEFRPSEIVWNDGRKSGAITAPWKL